MARATPTPKTPKPATQTLAEDLGKTDAPLSDPALEGAETTVTEDAVIVPGTQPQDALTPVSTPAAEPAVVLPAVSVAGNPSATPIAADASPVLRDTAVAETYARSDAPAVEAALGTMLPDAIVDEDEPRVVVICNVEGGRRRAGRRWPQGETTIPVMALSAHELAQLKGDPRFSVRPLGRG